MYFYNIKRLIKGKVELRKDVQCKKEIRIIEDNIYNSTLDIWCKKEVEHPRLIQYEVYKCFVLKYELAYSGFFHPEFDIFHYTLKSIAYTDNIDDFPIDSGDENSLEYANQFLENCRVLDRNIISEFMKNVECENGEWYMKK